MGAKYIDPKECLTFTQEEEQLLAGMFKSGDKSYFSMMNMLRFEHLKKYADTLGYPIDKDTAEQLLVMADGGFVWQLFMYLKSRGLTPDALAACLSHCYTCGRGFEGALKMFEECDKRDILDENDMRAYEALPEYLTVYRGTSIKESKSKKKGISFTTDRTVAEFFAFRGINGPSTVGRVVISTAIRKDEILAYFTGRNESEVIINPAKRQYEIVTTLPTEAYHNYMMSKNMAEEE